MTAGPANIPTPMNLPTRGYEPGSDHRAALDAELGAQSKETVELVCRVGGDDVTTGDLFEVRAPHRQDLVLASVHAADKGAVSAAIDAAAEAKNDWEHAPFETRAAVFLRAAELIEGPFRERINAATMLGQSKTPHQAEIDASGELVDFLRFNVTFAEELMQSQPDSAAGIWNRTDWRPLEGFVLAITPFNFTAIAGNLPSAPALMGNTVVWKPSDKQALSAQLTMEIFEQAGLPAGVINLLHGSGKDVSEAAIADPRFAGLHFTGSTAVFQSLQQQIAGALGHLQTYPRVVGETGGKDFVLAHPSADVDALTVALLRGAFEYQGQKCSAASRAYVARSVWDRMRDELVEQVSQIVVGDVAEPSTFMGAVINRESYDRLVDAQKSAADDSACDVIVGGSASDEIGFFVDPTIVVVSDPKHTLMETELFGPLLTVFVYDDADWDATLDLVDSTSPYALTGSIFADDRAAVTEATSRLRHAAGNFYVNDKPTGAVVGQQPFGGGRMSGTNDKAGSPLNLLRWTSPRSIKETLDPPTDWRYPYMG